MTSRGHSQAMGVSHTGDTQPDSKFNYRSLSDVLFVAGIVVFLSCSAASIPTALYMIFACKF